MAHALRIQRNDGENIPLFFAVGLIYALSGASAFGACVVWSVHAARIPHHRVHLPKQPLAPSALPPGRRAPGGDLPLIVNVL